MYETCDVI